MAVRAVEVTASQGLAGRGVVNLLCYSVSVVLMLVMSEVLGGCAALVTAIARHCRPGELDRQQSHQKDREKAAHLQRIADVRQRDR